MVAEDAPDDDPVVARAVQAGSPAVDDVAARLVRARVAAKLFGTITALKVGRYELERQLGAGGGGIVFVAKDPELSRRVALKLLGARGHRDQLLAEAHALARLAHPNVVPIFDVGTHDEQIFLVMELVEGGTLRTWLAAEPRTTRDIVRTYRDAGAGLAAAHRAGFIHRDFKPDNALVGADHRARVVDFGLVHVDGEARAGLGTPRYMPPEQAAGGTVTAAADQYSFCASLREALTARGDAVPRWLEVILARGLSRDPAARFPSMDALLDALALDPAARWRRRALVAGVVAVGATMFIVGRAQSSLPDCDGGKAELAQVWSPAVRDAIAAKLDALGTTYSREVRPQLVDTLDRYATSWTAGHLDACKVHRRGAQSDALFDRRMRCLDAARAALGAAASVVGDTTSEQLEKAVTATSELPALARCADAALLASPVAPPPSALAGEVAAVERELAAREVEARAGRTKVGAIEELIARARKLAYPPVLARALRLRGVAAIWDESRADAIAPLDEATRIAFTANEDELGIEAFARRAWAQGTHGKIDPALVLANIDVIESIAKRLPDGARGTRVLLESNIGSLELSLSHRDRARAAFERAYAEHAKVTGAMSVELAQVPANYALTIDDPVRRDMLLADVITKLSVLVGKTHPTTLRMRILAALLIEDAAVATPVLEAACSEHLAMHPTRGAGIRDCALELAWLALERDDRVTARRWFTVLAEMTTRGSEDAAKLAGAHLLRLDGDAPGAAAAFAALANQFGKKREPWWNLLPIIEAELGHALAERDIGSIAAARASFERARPLLVQVLDSDRSPSRRRRLHFVESALSSDSR